ncbi:glycosyltransferase [Pseudomonas sp. NPDC090755]|uniref:glycosyltransferase n=1 Tax=Pseudomonas sp. NPDC090755 TaxID=3364481 RepID=UPI003839D740
MTQPLDTLICFATRWGPQFGGINSFNHDLLGAFAALYYRQARTWCVVLWASEQEKADARAQQVSLISLGLETEKQFAAGHEQLAWAALAAEGVEPNEHCVWLGHDRITGPIALAAKARGGRTALIHHMSYERYEPFVENAQRSRAKEEEQRQLFEAADVVMAVGPLLRDALYDMLDHETIPMLVPGLAEITAKREPKTLKAFLSGRLSADASKIKQAHLGVAAFSQAIRQADAQSEMPNKFQGKNEPKLLLRGVDFEDRTQGTGEGAEAELRRYALEQAGRVVNIHPLPFTAQRQVLFDDLRGSTVAMMPSWHEGFGLVAWEAIAAGVPLIVSVKSGAYKLLEELEHGAYKSWVTTIDVEGSEEAPYHSSGDVERLSKALTLIAHDPSKRHDAARLREKLCGLYTWAQCAQSCGQALGWSLQEAAPVVQLEQMPQTQGPAVETIEPDVAQTLPGLGLPPASWRPRQGLSDSQLLRAEEAIVPFDSSREPFLLAQMEWVEKPGYDLQVRLLCGPGGVGKTRLALEMCRRLRLKGWSAGFLAGDSDTEKALELARNLTASHIPSLVVIDYAETRQSLMLTLFKALKGSNNTKPIRFLLLARAGGEWWRVLPSKDSQCEDLLEGPATSGPFQIPALHGSYEARQIAYRQALQAFAQRLEIEPPEHMPNLEDTYFSRPLYIQMAALMALRGERPKSAESLPRALVNHERRYWAKALAATEGAGDEIVHRAGILMTLSTLANGIATERVLEEILVVSEGERVEFKALYRALTPLYPDHHQGLHGLRPDVIGEALVAQSLLSARGMELLDQVLATGSSALRRSSLTVVARLLREREDLLPVIEEVLGRHFIFCIDDCIAVCLESSGPLLEVVEQVYQALPSRLQSQASGSLMPWLGFDIVPLAKLGIYVSRSQVRKYLEKKNKKETPRAVEEYLEALGLLAFALKNDGQTQEALTTIKQALALKSGIRRTRSNDLMVSWHLRVQSELLTLLGKNDESLVSAQHALQLTRQLVSPKNETNAGELARCLSICAGCMADCGRVVEALQLSEEGLQWARKLSRPTSPASQSDLAVSLSNFARCLVMNGHIQKSLAASEEGLEIRRVLMDVEPQKYRQNYALTMMNYASRLSDVGEIDEALRLIKESLSINRALSESKPERFSAVLGTTLNNCMVIEAEAGNFKGALGLATELLALYEQLVQNNQDMYLVEFEATRIECAYIRWLDNGQSMTEEAYKPVGIHSDTQSQRALEYQQSWLLAFAEQTLAAVINARASWEKLDFSQQFGMRNKHILLGAFSAQRLGACDGLWRESLAELRKIRKTRIPAWMTETARRMGFSLEA